MKLYLQEDHDLPLVSGIALVRTGSLLDPPQRIGLAQLAGITMRTGGTTVKTGEQIDTLLDNVAASIESAIGDSLGTLSFSALKENAPATLQLFKEMLTQPGFRQDKLELAKTQLRAAIAHRNDSARRHRAPRIRQPRLRQGYAFRLAAGVRHHRPHLAQRPARVPPALLLSGQRHARRLGRFQYRRDEGFAREALCRLDRAAAAGPRIRQGEERALARRLPRRKEGCPADFLYDRPPRRPAQR